MSDGRTVNRLRVGIGITVHPDTVTRFDEVCDKFNLPRGQVVDKLILALHTCIKQDKLTCVNGEVCRFGRVDVPPIL